MKTLQGESTDQLIDRLGDDVTPVKPLRSVNKRATVWLGGALAAGLALVYFMTGNPLAAVAEMDTRNQWLLLLKFSAGLLGVMAAFQLSVPGHRKIWEWLPLVPAVGWLAMAGEACLSLTTYPITDGSTLHYTQCFSFVVGLGIPLGAALFWHLRSGFALEPERTLMFGMLGVAGLVGAVMHCFHTQDGTIADMASHSIAVLLLVWYAVRQSAQLRVQHAL